MRFVAIPLLCLVALAVVPAHAQDEVHWLDENRYLIRYKDRERNVERRLEGAREKAIALCRLLGAAAYATNDRDLRERHRTSRAQFAVDVVMLADVDESAPDGFRPRACVGEVRRKVMESMRRALEEAGMLPG